MKKMLSVVLVICLVFASAITAFAQSTPDQVAPSVSGDAEIQAAWDALNAIDAAINNLDYDAMIAALEELDSLTEALSEEQSEEWNKVVEDNMGLDKYLDIIFKVIDIADIKYWMDEYAADPNVLTAYNFVDSYDYAKEEKLPISEMFDGIDELYDEALKDLPSEKIINIYNAYEEVRWALICPCEEDVDYAISEFEAVIDDFNELTEQELDELALLVGAEDGEEIFSWILEDWIYVNILSEIIQYYNAYSNNPTAETAQDFVDYYDSILEWEDEYLIDLVYSCFVEDINEVYIEAKAVLSGEDKDNAGEDTSPKPQTGGESTKTEESVTANTAPVQTGAHSTIVLAVSMLILMMGVAVFMSKKARQ